MPRKRLISPQFFTDGELFDAEAASGLPLRLAFAGLWCHADRRGYFEWRPRELKLGVIPHDAVDMSSTMLALCQFGFLKVFEHPEHPGKLFGVIPGFSKWQTFNIKERPDHHIPEPLTKEHITSTVPARFQHRASTPGTGTGTGTNYQLLPPKRKPRVSGGLKDTTWLTPVAEVYEQRNGPGSFSYGEAAGAFKRLKQHLSVAEIADRLARYLDATKPEFQSLQKFAKTHAAYAADAPKPLSRELLAQLDHALREQAKDAEAIV